MAPRSTPPDTIRAATADPDTSRPVWLPDVVTVHDTMRVTETRVDTVRMPTGVDLGGLITETPVRRQSRVWGTDALELTYWDAGERRWMQERYELSRPSWSLYPELETAVTPQGLRASGRLVGRWRRLQAFAGYTATGETRGWSFGVRWRPFSLP